MLLLTFDFDAGGREIHMKLAGFLMLLAGWILVVAALALLASAGTRVIFVLAGIVVEVVGLVLVFRSHLRPKDE